MTPCADPLSFPAPASLERPLWEHDIYICSMDELWRAAGSPGYVSPAECCSGVQRLPLQGRISDPQRTSSSVALTTVLGRPR